MTKKERNWTLLVLLILTVVFVPNLLISLRKARDAQRKHDVGQMVRAAEAFQDSVGHIPASTDDGKMVACDGGKDASGIQLFRACDWGEKSDFLPVQLVSDPYDSKGYRYKYVANGKVFQVFAHLEGKSEAEYSKAIAARKLACGNQVCNFGLGSTGISLDKPLESVSE